MKKLLALVVLLFWAPSYAAVSLVGTPSAVTSGGTYTAETGSNRLVVITVGAEGLTTSPNVSAVVFGSATLANGKVVEAASAAQTPGATRGKAYVYYVKEANIDSGSQTLSVTWDGNATANSGDLMEAYTIAGVDQTTPVEATSSTFAPVGTPVDPLSSSLTVASGSGQVLAGLGNSPTAGSTPADGTWTEYRDDDDSSVNRTQSHGRFGQASGSVTYGLDWASSQGAVVAVASFGAAVTEAPAFDSGPTVTPIDNNTFRVTYDGNADSDNIYCGAWLKDATTPSTAEVVAGTGAHGTGTEAVTGSSDTLDFDVTDSPAYPIYDVYCVTKGTSVVSSLGSQVDEYLTAATGYQFITLASIGSGSPVESFNTAVTPDLVAGDILVAPTTTSPGTYTLTIGTDGQFSYSGDASRQLALNILAYDVSAAGYHASDIDFVANDPSPVCDVDFEQVIVVDAAMTGIDLDSYCSHPLGDTLTYAKSSGTYPTGITLTTDTVGGTPTVEDEAGAALVFSATNPYGGTASQTLTLFPIVTWTLSDCTTGPLDAASCAGLIDALIRSTGAVNSTYQCSTTVDPNYVISQSPAASAEIAPFTDVDLLVARACARNGRGINNGSIRIGL